MVTISIEDDEVVTVRGSDNEPGQLRVFITQVAANGDSRSSSHKATVAEEGHPAYEAGDVDFTEKLQHLGDVSVRVETAAGDEVASEVFHLGG